MFPRNQSDQNMFEENQLFGFGDVPEFLKNSVLKLKDYSSAPIKKISCGRNHYLLLFQDGKLYGFGGNEEGQLGLAITPQSKKVDKMSLIKIHSSIAKEYHIDDIAAGDSFSLLLLKFNNKSKIIRFGIDFKNKYKASSKNDTLAFVEELPSDIPEISRIYAFGKRKKWVYCRKRSI